MIWQIIKKQGLLFLRNPQQLLLLIALPIILVMILGTALSGMMNGSSSPLSLKIAFLESEGEEEQVKAFLADVKEQLPVEAFAEIEANLGNMLPVSTIKSVFDSEEVRDFIEVEYLKPSERNEIIKDDSYTAVIEVPKNFSYDLLTTMIVGGTAPTLKVTYNEEKQVGTSIIASFLTQMQNQFTKQNFLAQQGIQLSELAVEEMKAEIVTVNEKNPIEATSYYTIGMVVMNVLFIAGAISYYAFHEKQIGVFNRIILADVSRWVYFTGVFLTGMIFSFIQAIVIFAFSWLVFGISWPDVGLFLLVTVAFSFAVGGLTVFLSALNYKLNSEMITNFFMNIIVILLSVLGGSFFPIGDYVPAIQSMGNMTPNGSGLSAYISILRGENIAAISENLLFLVGFGMIMILIAVLCFPKRGVSA
ncbi:ABC transporter permease [Ornithinibacillus scapharcae]|uniref:ABC transporter permease n=1 Tax=Ornithinibacillus scapharcae TaxID=1147159 RepID=UPI000225AD47|nr:ABC transporter permease [Ornithinibacillus scapharcae]